MVVLLPLGGGVLPGVALLSGGMVELSGVAPVPGAVLLSGGMVVLSLPVAPGVVPAPLSVEPPVPPVMPPVEELSLVPAELPVAPELLVPALSVPRSHAPKASVATKAVSSTEYFMPVPLKNIVVNTYSCWRNVLALSACSNIDEYQ